MAKDKNKRLQELDGSSYEIADGQPDIHGWDVKDASGRRIGEVDDLIFDPQSRKVRYIVVDLEENDFDLEERDVLVPIGLAELRDNGDDVILNGVAVEQLQALPEYDDDEEISPEYESRIRSVFAATGSTQDYQSDFYNHEHFNEENLYRNRRSVTDHQETSGETIPVIRENLEVGKQEIERGGIRLRSRIVETPVEERVTLQEENISIERTAVDRLATEASLREESIEMREQAEVPVVSKEARVVEEISLNKEVEERDVTVRDTVRETEVDIERQEGDRTRSADDDRNRL